MTNSLGDLRHICECILDDATDEGNANTVSVHRNLLGELRQALRGSHEPGVVQRVCHALTDNCVMFTDPERPPCTPENCAAMRAAQKSGAPLPTSSEAVDCSGVRIQVFHTGPADDRLLLATDCLRDIEANSSDEWARESAGEVICVIKSKSPQKSGEDRTAREAAQRRILDQRLAGRTPKHVDIDDIGAPHLRED